MCTFFCFFFCEQKKQKKVPKKKKKKRTVFYVFTEALPPFSRVFLFGFAKSLCVRYCATHTLTISPHPSPPPLGRKEYAEHCLKGEVQNVGWAYLPNKNSAERSEDDENNGGFSFSLLYFLLG